MSVGDKNGRMWAEGPEGAKDVVAYVNDTPELHALFLELDLLGHLEQEIDDGSEAWDTIFTIANHWRESELRRGAEACGQRMAELGAELSNVAPVSSTPPKPIAPMRPAFDKWLHEEMGLESDKDFSAHLAWKAWQAATWQAARSASAAIPNKACPECGGRLLTGEEAIALCLLLNWLP